MKLELDLDEAKAVLLAYAQTQFPGMFDTVDVQASYGILQKVTFSREWRPLRDPKEDECVDALLRPGMLKDVA